MPWDMRASRRGAEFFAESFPAPLFSLDVGRGGDHYFKHSNFLLLRP